MTKLLAVFLPHHSNRHKAHAIKAPAIFAYIVFLILLQISLRTLSIPGSSILGISTHISSADIISLTNERRISQGIGAVKENPLLSAAAAAKAQDMLDQNYWAHFAPNGNTPWQFIGKTGYKYSVAGENLARDFDSASAVVVAWMNSPSHKQNLLDNSFTEIGVAVTEGNLKGVNGSLVVQMFAAPANPPAQTVSEKPKSTSNNQSNNNPSESTLSAALGNNSAPDSSGINVDEKATEPIVAGSSSVVTQYKLNPYSIIKTASLIISGFLVLLIAIDIVYVRRNRINRAAHHSVAHVLVFSVFAIVILFISSGSIL